ncbi:grainy head isoform X3 [Rhodnius prolixus]|uniref:grainy head isoform X3 n=1 Tax=Rhodnius prolixus TaxID=13249 RepID=UPI003D18A02E
MAGRRNDEENGDDRVKVENEGVCRQSLANEEDLQPQGSPLLLTTMTPVSIATYDTEQSSEHPHGHNKLMYVGDDGTTDEMLVAAELARCGQPPTGDGPCPDQSNAYHPRQQTTVLVLSDLVHHISPILSLRNSGAASSLLGTAAAGLKAGCTGSTAGLDLAGQPLADIQGLFLGQGGEPPTASGQVKREPEDLSHSRQHTAKDSHEKGIRHKVVLVATTNSGAHQQDLVVDVVNNNSSASIKDEFMHSPQQTNRSMNGTPSSTSSMMAQDVGPTAPIEIISENLKPGINYGSHHIFSTLTAGHSADQDSDSPSPNPYTEHHYSSGSSAVASAHHTGYLQGATSRQATALSTSFTDPYYREYFADTSYAAQLRNFADGPEPPATIVERYVRQSSAYHNKGVIAAAGLTVDLPSPDSGIGADAITPRDQTTIQQSFEYSDMCPGPLLTESGCPRASSAHSSPGTVPARSRPWHDFGRQNDADKIQIPKVFSQYGFKYHLETPISTNQRREDDRVTYINKGQFYGITMEYIPDPDRPLKTQTVKSIVMLMFREEKSPDDEIKAWQFWHGRQHSVKQRILDADTKNSVGFVGCIEEVAHNAIAVYWNPLESSAKLNIAVQCLSTDFSSQKGVKGLPLHIQIDTYEDPREGPVIHRGYCQIKVFCDKGAERKTRDEERRAAKRKMAATGRKKIEELYHPACERSEFYSMADLTKPPVLFSPAEDIDKLTSMELSGFYGHDTDASSLSNGEAGPLKHSSPYLLHSVAAAKPGGCLTGQTLKFHNHFPPDAAINDKKDEALTAAAESGVVFSSPPLKRPKLVPPLNERVMLYVRQESEDVYTPLHIVPPTTTGLLNADYGKN